MVPAAPPIPIPDVVGRGDVVRCEAEAIVGTVSVLARVSAGIRLGLDGCEVVQRGGRAGLLVGAPP